MTLNSGELSNKSKALMRSSGRRPSLQGYFSRYTPVRLANLYYHGRDIGQVGRLTKPQSKCSNGTIKVSEAFYYYEKETKGSF